MTQHRIDVLQEFSKPVEEIFSYLSDHNNLSKVFGIPVKRIKDGDGEVNGVGSVRALGFAPLATDGRRVYVYKKDRLVALAAESGQVAVQYPVPQATSKTSAPAKILSTKLRNCLRSAWRSGFW